MKIIFSNLKIGFSKFLLKYTNLLVGFLLIILLMVFVNSIVNNSLSVFQYLKAVILGVYDMTKNPIYYLILIVFILTLFFCLIYIYKKLITLEIRKIHFFLLVLIIFLIGFLNVITSEIYLISDWQRYYETGILLSKNIELFDFYNVYHRRALFYTVPVFSILPESIGSVQFINLIIHLLSASIFTYVIYKDFGKLVAFRFLLFYSISFEFYTSLTIASHDVAFLFYFSILVLLFQVLKNIKSLVNSISVIVVISIIIIIIDFQRDVKIPLMLALILMLVLQLSYFKSSINLKHAGKLFLIILTVFGFSLIISAMKTEHSQKTNFYGIANMLYSYNDIYTEGNYRSGQINRINYINQLSQDERQYLALKKYCTQISEYPIGMLSLIQNKATNLFSLTPFTLSNNDLKYNFFDKSNLWILKFLLLSVFIIIKLSWMLFGVIGLLKLIINGSIKHYSKLYVLFPIVIIPLFFVSEVNPSYQLILYPSLLFFSAIGSFKMLKY